MTLKSVAMLLVLSAASLAEGGQISRNNPYRSFNISGINYGSQQWEREHRQTQSQPSPVRMRRGGFFRR